MMRLFFIFSIFFVSSLAGLEKMAVSLASDAYESPKIFVQKYSALGYKVQAYKSDHIHFYTLISDDGTLYVVFEGSTTIHSWESNLNIGEIAFLKDESRKVHRGFYQEALLAKAYLQKNLAFREKIVVTGHSLGAAIALLFASILHENGYDVTLLTFGSPPVGNQAFVSSMQRLMHKRYNHILDVIPKMKKKYIDKMKSAVNELNTHIEDSQTIKSLLDQIEGISYDYVHHGESIVLHNIERLSLKQGQASFAKRVLLKSLMYHSIKTYQEGLKKGPSIVFDLLHHFL